MEQREHLLSLGIADAVKYRLRLLASGDESFFAQLGEVLREGGLAQADSLGQLASREFARFRKKAEDQQAGFVRQRLE